MSSFWAPRSRILPPSLLPTGFSTVSEDGQYLKSDPGQNLGATRIYMSNEKRVLNRQSVPTFLSSSLKIRRLENSNRTGSPCLYATSSEKRSGADKRKRSLDIDRGSGNINPFLQRAKLRETIYSFFKPILTPAPIQTILSVLDVKQVKPGEIIFRQGEKLTHYIFLLEGKALLIEEINTVSRKSDLTLARFPDNLLSAKADQNLPQKSSQITPNFQIGKFHFLGLPAEELSTSNNSIQPASQPRLIEDPVSLSQHFIHSPNYHLETCVAHPYCSALICIVPKLGLHGLWPELTREFEDLKEELGRFFQKSKEYFHRPEIYMACSIVDYQYHSKLKTEGNIFLILEGECLVEEKEIRCEEKEKEAPFMAMREEVKRKKLVQVCSLGCAGLAGYFKDNFDSQYAQGKNDMGKKGDLACILLQKKQSINKEKNDVHAEIEYIVTSEKLRAIQIPLHTISLLPQEILKMLHTIYTYQQIAFVNQRQLSRKIHLNNLENTNNNPAHLTSLHKQHLLNITSRLKLEASVSKNSFPDLSPHFASKASFISQCHKTKDEKPIKELKMKVWREVFGNKAGKQKIGYQMKIFCKKFGIANRWGGELKNEERKKLDVELPPSGYFDAKFSMRKSNLFRPFRYSLQSHPGQKPSPEKSTLDKNSIEFEQLSDSPPLINSTSTLSKSTPKGTCRPSFRSLLNFHSIIRQRTLHNSLKNQISFLENALLRHPLQCRSSFSNSQIHSLQHQSITEFYNINQMKVPNQLTPSESIHHRLAQIHSAAYQLQSNATNPSSLYQQFPSYPILLENSFQQPLEDLKAQALELPKLPKFIAKNNSLHEHRNKSSLLKKISQTAPKVVELNLSGQFIGNRYVPHSQ